MKIGDEVYVHGYVDEIRNDVVIIRNDGGYFGTVPSEIKADRKDEPQTERTCTNCKHNGVLSVPKCDECHDMDKHEFIEPQTDCDDRYAVRNDSGEIVAYACNINCTQTDCPWK